MEHDSTTVQTLRADEIRPGMSLPGNGFVQAVSTHYQPNTCWTSIRCTEGDLKLSPSSRVEVQS